MKKKTFKVLIAVLFLLGLGVLLYPIVTSFISGRQQAYVVRGYDSYVKSMDDEKRERSLQEAREYNKTLVGGAISDPFSGDVEESDAKRYLSLLDNDGVMGEVEVPKIGLALPIYHGTSEAVLQKGAGHLYGTSLPVGGQGTHAVITGHRGLPESTLFTNLDKMEEGDRFYIKVMGETLAYEVDSIKVVEPENTEALQIIPGKDCVTLLTCTPYGINSHRLLVRGVRVPMEMKKAEDEAKVEILETKNTTVPFIIGGTIAMAIIILAVFYKRKKGIKK